RAAPRAARAAAAPARTRKATWPPRAVRPSRPRIKWLRAQSAALRLRSGAHVPTYAPLPASPRLALWAPRSLSPRPADAARGSLRVVVVEAHARRSAEQLGQLERRARRSLPEDLAAQAVVAGREHLPALLIREIHQGSQRRQRALETGDEW